MFANIPAPASDEIIDLMARSSNDERAFKVDLTVGVYKDSNDNTLLMKAVKEADQLLAKAGRNKSYVGSKGDLEYVQLLQELVLANQSVNGYISGVQTAGGSGGLRAILDVIKLANPDAKIWVSDPTYANHIPTIIAAGLAYEEYPFIDHKTMMLDEQGMFNRLEKLGKNDVVLLHGSCHNPSGLRLTSQHWQQIAQLSNSTHFLPLIDTAYQGFADGLTEDAAGLLTVANTVERLALCVSCSKNFGVYSDRVGAAYILSPTEEEANTVQAQLAIMSKTTYWVPPSNGAEIVKTILKTPALKKMWSDELSQINVKIKGIRAKLCAAFRQHSGDNYFDYILSQEGMFAMLPASEEQMELLRVDYGVYGLNNGRINLASIPEQDIDYLVTSVLAVTRAVA
ncbi:aromatic amino acid transaminase [Colwellia psychrerythraea]|uniref:Aromatic-amino-acid transaminase n=1 Tax=Colwellia psychrerythraea TaxID=28229 RepID=A0A099KK31_COLPS|nr:aromatic amino acid transaminase [Colwellia psychrerythraea]KGJ90771.1 Aromatic-amino-acid transaminase [Colwellia psychrerythraea]